MPWINFLLSSFISHDVSLCVCLLFLLSYGIFGFQTNWFFIYIFFLAYPPPPWFSCWTNSVSFFLHFSLLSILCVCALWHVTFIPRLLDVLMGKFIGIDFSWIICTQGGGGGYLMTTCIIQNLKRHESFNSFPASSTMLKIKTFFSTDDQHEWY